MHSPESRVALFFLTEKSGKRFRETETNLGFIEARLKEPEVDIEGVKTMISRQCSLWLNTNMAEYLRPETLFNKTKFDSYYAAREADEIEPGGRNPHRKLTNAEMLEEAQG
mgnify:CR=1 FL=1